MSLSPYHIFTYNRRAIHTNPQPYLAAPLLPMTCLTRPSDSHMLRIRLPGNNILESRQYFGPVLELLIWNTLSYAVLDKIYILVNMLITAQCFIGHPAERRGGFSLPRPCLANRRSVSFAAERSETPSPA